MTIDASQEQSALDQHEQPRFERTSFLASSRAVGACTRELTHLSDTLVQGITALGHDTDRHKPVVRLSPGRCIVQLGSVAITATWLRPNLGSVEDGELLVIIWHGTVAASAEHFPERESTRRVPRTATALWEQILKAHAVDEAGWVWSPKEAGAQSYSSVELGARCVDRLRAAYNEHEPVV